MNPRSCTTLHVITLLVLQSLNIPCANAQRVGRAVALRAATSYLARGDANTLRKKGREIIETVDALLNEENDTLGFVANIGPDGFFVLSNDLRIAPVILTSPAGRLYPLSTTPHPLLDILRNDLELRCKAIDENALTTTLIAVARNAWDALLQGSERVHILEGAWPSDTAGWLETHWGQGYPFNMFCPVVDSSTGQRAYAGCIAIAMAQLVNYWGTMTGLPESVHFTNTRGTLTPDTLANFDGMVYPPPNDTLLGKLAFACATSVRMKFGADYSGAYLEDVPGALAYRFGFHNVPPLQYPLTVGVPVIVGLTGGPNLGHAAVMDGYKVEDGVEYHHLEFGWNGNYSGPSVWYSLPSDLPSQYSVVYGHYSGQGPTPGTESTYSGVFPFRDWGTLTVSGRAWKSGTYYMKLYPGISGWEVDADSVFLGQVSENGSIHALFNVKAGSREGSFSAELYRESRFPGKFVLVERSGSIEVEADTRHFINPHFAGTVAVFYFQGLPTLNGAPLRLGDEIAICDFDSGGQGIVATFVYPGNEASFSVGVPIESTDSTGKTYPGAKPGNRISFRLWSDSADAEFHEFELWSALGPHDSLFSDQWFTVEHLNFAGQQTFVRSDPTVPKAFYLKQNYPNPFNPATRVEYGLPVESAVMLTVHDLLGRRVSVLFEGQSAAGSYSVLWTPQLPSGVYFMHLRASPAHDQGSSYVSVKKIMLAK